MFGQGPPIPASGQFSRLVRVAELKLLADLDSEAWTACLSPQSLGGLSCFEAGDSSVLYELTC